VASAGPLCKSAPHSRQITMLTPTTRFLQAGCPSCRPTNSVKALKVTNKQKNAYSVWYQSLLNKAKVAYQNFFYYYFGNKFVQELVTPLHRHLTFCPMSPSPKMGHVLLPVVPLLQIRMETPKQNLWGHVEKVVYRSATPPVTHLCQTTNGTSIQVSIHFLNHQIIAAKWQC